MKVIELLLQGKEVWDKKHTGYYELDKRDNKPVLVYKDKESFVKFVEKESEISHGN